jgi:hypothetical protein
MSEEADVMAPPGAIWICGACGKASKSRYGDDGTFWDESCTLNATLCHDDPPTFGEDGVRQYRAFKLSVKKA